MTKSTVYNSRKSRALIAQANSHNFLCKIGDGENVVTELTRQHLDRTTTPRASESWQIVVSFYGMVGSYTLQWAVPSLTARPETRVHGQEVRVNTGWPSPRSVQHLATFAWHNCVFCLWIPFAIISKLELANQFAWSYWGRDFTLFIFDNHQAVNIVVYLLPPYVIRMKVRRRYRR